MKRLSRRRSTQVRILREVVVLRRLLAVAVVTLAIANPGAAQSLRTRVDRLLDAPPFDRATWGVILTDSAGRVLYARNAERLFVPASNTKLVVAAAASALLPPDFRIETSVYGGGPVVDGTLHGDLVLFGRGDPTFSDRCYGTDTLALGACERVWDRLDALADSVAARGIRHVAGAVVGDGSFFDAEFLHPAWDTYDVNWWYGSPVSALGINDNAVEIAWGPGDAVDAPATVRLSPDLGLVRLENRTRTTDSGTATSIDFFRHPGTLDLWAEGTVAEDSHGRIEYFALPDPNLYAAAALRAALARRGISVAGPTRATADSLAYAAVRAGPPLARYQSRSRDDLVFPILNTSQNWFAEMLLKTIGRRFGTAGSWAQGLEVERRFLIDSVGIDSVAFSLSDGSGLSAGNVVSPAAFARLLRYVWTHPQRAGFLRALPRSGQLGSLRTRFVGTPLEGRVVAKTGSIRHVNSLSGYVERPRGGPLVFSVMANNHTVPGRVMLAQIDSVVVQMAR
jgi:D-alanyl-D-alanine carboxypeptidase/D-alanyl-D-alanine-endopeptidase (penicillin-binding protein 4)